LQEFKKFMLRGNIIDLSVGVIIGGAFNKIVSSLTADIITPLLTLLIGSFYKGENGFSGLNYYINENLSINVGTFITYILDFLITGAAIFLLVKLINKLNDRMKKPVAAAPPTTKKCPYCLSEISIEATRCPFCTSEQPEPELEPNEDDAAAVVS